MLMAATTLTDALSYYRRLCHVPDVASAQRNRLAGLPIILDACREDHRLIECLRLARDQTEIDSRLVADAVGIRMTNAATQLAMFWKQAIQVRGCEPERIFFERRKVNRAAGGYVLWYRLSALGTELMREDGSCVEGS